MSNFGYFKYDNIDMSESPYFLDLLDAPRPAIPGIRQDIKGLGVFDGSSVDGGAVESLVWELTCAVHGTSPATTRAAMDAVKFLLDTRVLKKFWIPQWPDRYWMVLPHGTVGQGAMGAGETGYDMNINFIAPDPNGFSEDETNQVVALVSSPQVVTVLAANLSNATTNTYPVIDIEATGGAPSGVTIVNAATEEAIEITRGISATNWVRFDCGLKIIYDSTDGITWTANMSTKVGSFITLLPQVANALTVIGVTNGEITITYRERFKA